MNKLLHASKTLMAFQNFDALAVGVIDFNHSKFNSFEVLKDEDGVITEGLGGIYYDLASVTKPLTNSLSYYLRPDVFDEKMLLCLEHRGGLPSWGLLSRLDWKEQILNYKVKESDTLYSDFSALRVLLELENKGINQKKICSEIWDTEVFNWLDLPPGVQLLQYGYLSGMPNFGIVHDPNAKVINEFCSHAGLFSTISGLCKTLINFNKQTDFISKVQLEMKSHSRRFVRGWDRVENPQNTLAGLGCGPHTFGHLGFTGTSVWIDADRMLGHVILSNATKYYWYEKEGLNEIRRALGEIIWSGNY